MPGNSFGELFRITTWGESHGGGVGVIVDGCPPGLPISLEEIQAEVDRRKPRSTWATGRREEDSVQLLSGIYEGQTLGTPICLFCHNKDVRSSDYDHLKDLFRPSHADFTTLMKYGVRDYRGGGRSSARETVGRVAAGAIARKLLRHHTGAEILGYVRQIGPIVAAIDPATVTVEAVEATDVHCPDPAKAQEMIDYLDSVRRSGDSAGGVIELVARNVPVGWGDPVFDKLDADLAKAVLSIQTTKGFEIGEGFAAAAMRGSEHNDPFVPKEGRIRTRTNRSGGVQGGISNGEDIVIRVAFKPVSTIRIEQDTVTTAGDPVKLAASGRHDACVVPRAVVIVESMVAMVLADHWLRQRALRGDAAGPIPGGPEEGGTGGS